ncbi:MAG: DUF3846 domain-containing protein [Methylotenera sp.]|nr:DUF3846 domain-containing protein [Methylotenera sp.]MDP2152364.1 DUF3846 domain-containing protein [Methylotenera sp.]MDP3059613.1 DUF3846 domain-containing protein [Methylotenera sp.]
MKAFLIDPYNQTITEVKYDGNYKTIQKIIGCAIFDIARFNDNTGDGIYIDDEGMFCCSKDRRFFVVYPATGAPTILAGRGLALGCDLATGESQSLTCSFDELANRIAFISEHQALQLIEEHGL